MAEKGDASLRISRRKVMQAGTAGALSLAAMPRMAPATPAGDRADPAGRQRTYMMVRGSLDDRLVIRWISSRYYAVMENAMTPMYNTHAATFSRFRRLADGPQAGGYEMLAAEIAWFTDIATGKPLETWYNPFVDRTVTIPMGGIAPSRSILTTDLDLVVPHAAPGMEMRYEVLPFEQRGSDIWITERIRTEVDRGPAAGPFRYSQNSIYRTSTEALSAPGAAHVTSDVSYTNLLGWRPYLEMGDTPGHMMSIGAGQHGATFASIPDEWHAATREKRPEVHADPGALLKDVWENPPA